MLDTINNARHNPISDPSKLSKKQINYQSIIKYTIQESNLINGEKTLLSKRLNNA